MTPFWPSTARLLNWWRGIPGCSFLWNNKQKFHVSEFEWLVWSKFLCTWYYFVFLAWSPTIAHCFWLTPPWATPPPTQQARQTRISTCHWTTCLRLPLHWSQVQSSVSAKRPHPQKKGWKLVWFNVTPIFCPACDKLLAEYGWEETIVAFWNFLF